VLWKHPLTHGGVICRFPLIKILLRDQTVLIEPLSAVVIELGFLQVGLLQNDVRLSSLIARIGCLHTGLIRIDHCALSLHVRIRLDIFLQEQLVTLFNVVAFLYEDVDNAAKTLRSDVGVGRGFDFAGGGYHRHEGILFHNLGGLDCDYTLIGLIYAVPGNTPERQDAGNTDTDLLPQLHAIPSQISRNLTVRTQ